jgi:hypothetical protein
VAKNSQIRAGNRGGLELRNYSVTMPRPTDNFTGEENPGDSPPAGSSGLRKVPMIDPGFHEDLEPSVLRPRILGLKKPANPSDRRNLKFLAVAFLVALVIFSILEYKQFREAAREAKQSAMEFMGTK